VTAATAPDPADRAHPRRVLLWLGLTPLLGVIGLVVGLAVGVRGADVVELALALVTTALALLPLILDQGRRPSERHVLLSTFSLVFIIGFVLPVLVIFIPAVGPADAPGYGFSALLPADIIRGQLTVILGLAVLLIGYVSPLGRTLGAPVPRFRTDWSLSATLAVAAVIIPFGWAILLAGVFGQISAALGSGLIGVFASAYLYGIALLTIAFLRHRSRVAFLTLAVLVPVTSFFGLFTGSKSAVLIPFVMVGLAVVVVRRRIGVRWILLGVLATTIVYPVGTFVREDILVENTLTTADALRDPNATLGRVSEFVTSSRSGEYFFEGILSTVARMDCIGAASVLIRDTPSVAPFQYGRTLGLFFVAFIPRVIWPGKPTITIGRYITDVYGSGPEIESNTAPTQLGEFYMNFGYAGVVVGMLLYGVLLRLLHEVLLRGQPTTPGLFAAIIVLLYLGMGFQGGVANNFANTVLSIVPIVVAHLAVSMLFPARGPRLTFGPGRGSPVAQR
jgi:hypothetical protein